MLHTLFRAKPSAGLVDVLAGQAALDDCLQATSVVGLQFLAVGNPQYSSRIRPASGPSEAAIAALREQFELVVIDLPAAGNLGPLVSFASAIDAVLLVVRSQHARKQSAKQVVRRLFDDGVPLAGAVLTNKRSDLPHWLEQAL
jgi:Mrp family chromosome partitioning ATPase